MTRRHTLTTLATTAAIGLFAMAAHADLIVQEGFNYIDGFNFNGGPVDTSETTGLAAGSWSGGFNRDRTATSGSLGVGAHVSAFNKMHFETGDNIAWTALTSSAGGDLRIANDAGTYSFWASTLVKTPTSFSYNGTDVLDGTLRIGVEYRDDSEILGFSIDPTNATAANVGLSVPNGFDDTISYAGTTTLSIDTTYLLLARFDIDDNESAGRLWLYDTSSPTTAPADVDAIASITGNYSRDLDATDLRINETSPNSQTGIFYDIDEVRIGETFTDVVLVPEPGSLALVLMGLGAVCLLRTRQRAGR